MDLVYTFSHTISYMRLIIMLKLSPYQEVFYNEWKLNPARSDYNILFDQEIEAEINHLRLERSLQRLMEDHLVLHSRLKEEEDNYYWEQDEKISIKIDYFPNAIDDATALAYVKSPFNLEKGPLLRCGLIQLSNTSYRLLIVIHHIVMDAAKGNFFIDLVSRYYNNEEYTIPISLQEQYEKLRQLNARLEELLFNNKVNNQQFWQIRNQDAKSIDFTFLKSYAMAQKKNEILAQIFSFDASILQQLKQVQKKIGVTIYLFGKAVFVALLHRYTEQDVIATSCPIAIHEGDDFIFGAHINSVLSSYHFPRNLTFLQLLEHVKQDFKEIKLDKHHYCPIQEVIAVAPHVAGALDVSFIQTNLKDHKLNFNGIIASKINQSMNVDLVGKLSFEQQVQDDVINFKVKYANQFIDTELLQGFIDAYKNFFKQVLSDLLSGSTDRPIFEYDLISSQQHCFLKDLNNTQRSFSHEKTIHQCFEEQVVKTPDNIAVIYQDNTLTYSEINKKANQLAHYLIECYHPQPDDLIGVCLERSEYLLIAVLAVLKAGAAYVPIAPDYPKQRIEYLWEDTQAKAIITSQSYQERILSLQNIACHQIVNLDDPALLTSLDSQTDSNPQIETKSHDLAYVIYTSGTTGKPKGVMLEHRGIINRIQWMNHTFPLNEQDRIFQKTPYVFDVSVWEIFWANWYGASVVFARPEQHKDANYIANAINEYQISVIHFTPSMLDAFEENLSQRQPKNHLSSLRYIFCSGEALLLETVKRCHRLLPHVAVHNLYGPTEASIDVLHFDCTNESIEAVYIGKSIDNTIFYVLDSHHFLTPIGAVGELYIGGIGLARGYLNQLELTEKNFIKNPFPVEWPNNTFSKLYKTGDMVRLLPNGNVEYFGRNDQQLKLRGNRIELGEIQCVLIGYPGIRQAIVVAKNSCDKISNSHFYLVAYYVSDQPLDESGLRSYLAQHLPDFMIPSFYVHIENIPLTTNGKLDEKALPLPTHSKIENYQPPVNEVQKFICAAYAQILKIEKVGINDDFFMLGGNSILAIKLATKLQKDYRILLTDIFTLRTPEKIARATSSIQGDLYDSIQPLCDFYVNKIIYATNDVVLEEYLGHRAYFKKNPENTPVYKVKVIRNVLLTGSTGHLGCHILSELLTKTEYKVYLLIREQSDECAFNRLHRKYSYYFGEDLNNFKDRLVIFASDLADAKLGLNRENYQYLTSQIDSTIHCAALVKYYGQYEEFYQANILSTINIIEFAKATNNKDVHYISTVGVLMDGYIPNKTIHVFDEEDDLKTFVSGHNFYNQTKRQAEQLVFASRTDGITSNVYRMGNLGMNSETSQVQENLSDNVFFNHLKTILDIGIIPKEFSAIEISPVNCAALAVVKLFDKVALSNQTYHIFNSQVYSLFEKLKQFQHLSIREGSVSDFICSVLDMMKNCDLSTKNNLFILYQIWLQEAKENHSTRIRIAQIKTELILNQLGFFWPPITAEMLLPFINQNTSLT